MRIFIFLLVYLLSITSSLVAQENGSVAQIKEYPGDEYSYIYQLTRKEANDYFNARNPKLDSNNFHTLIEKIHPLQKLNTSTLKPGYYIMASVPAHYVNAKLFNVSNIETRILNNNSGLNLILTDRRSGKPIVNAKVHLGNSVLEFNTEMGWYTLNKRKKEGRIKIETEEELLFIDAELKYNAKEDNYKERYEGFIAFDKP